MNRNRLFLAVAAVGCLVLAGWVAASLMEGPGVSVQDVTWQSSGDVGCTLEPVTGTLVDRNGRTVLTGAAFQGPPPPGAPMPDMVVRWPAGWRVDRVNGRLEVRNPAGKLEAYSGEVVGIDAASLKAPGLPDVVDDALLACPVDVFEGGWPPSSEPSDSRNHASEIT